MQVCFFPLSLFLFSNTKLFLPPDGAAPLRLVPCCDGVQRGGAVDGGVVLSHWLLRLPTPRQGEPHHLSEHSVMETVTSLGMSLGNQESQENITQAQGRSQEH